MNINDAPITEPAPPSLDQARRAFERDYLTRVLTMTQGNVTNAARIAGRNRTEFYRLLDRNALSPGMFKPSLREGRESSPVSDESRIRG